MADNDKSFGDAWRKTASEYFEVTTIGALPQVYYSQHNSLKLVWVVVIALGLVLTVVHTRSILNRYYSYPTQIQLFMKSNESLDFPAVTVCNLNPVKKSKIACSKFRALVEIQEKYQAASAILQAIGYNDSVTGKIMDIVDKYDHCDNTGEARKPTAAQETVKVSKTKPLDDPAEVEKHVDEEMRRLAWLNEIGNEDRYNFGKFLNFSKVLDFKDIIPLAGFTRADFNRYGYSYDDFVIECTIDRTNCNETWFTKVVNHRYGNCYTFNRVEDGVRGHITRRAGGGYGLRLTLNVNYSEYVGLLAADYGVRVTVHTAGAMPVPEDFGFNAPPGMKTMVGIRRSETNRLALPYKTNCTVEYPKLYMPYTDGISKYSLDLCKMACKDFYLHKKCSCVAKLGTNSFNVSMCDIFNATQRICKLLVESKFHLGSTNEKALKCHCPPSCTDSIFRMSVAGSKWPSVPYQQLKILNFPIEHRVSEMFLKSLLTKYTGLYENFTQGFTVNENLVRLHVYYESLIYESIDESPLYPASQLLADFGAVAGLYLGLTIVSTIELLQMLLLVCYNFCVGRKNKQLMLDGHLPLSANPDGAHRVQCVMCQKFVEH